MNGATFGFSTPASNSSPAGTLFGAAPATSTASTGGLFGATSNNTSAAGTLFGGSAANASSGFGGFNKPATSTGFGAPPATPTTSSFGGFGSASASTATPSLGLNTTSGFGAPATSTAGGFGATNTTGFGTPATSTAGGFGAATTGFGAPATSTATGFGAPAAATTGFGTTPATGFGATSTTAGTGFGGGFGGLGATAQKPGGFGTGTTGGLFGSKPAGTTGFGAPLQQQQPFGAAGVNATQQQQQQQPVQEKVWQELALIRAHFDPNNALCQFRHYFYNMVPANEVHLYVRPQNQDEQLWNEAMRKNPDPKCMVPVLAVGFDDILKRMEIQSKQVDLHQEKLKETAARLTTVQRQYLLGTLVKLEEHKRRHTDLTQRLLRLLRYSQVLRYKGFPLNADEEQAMAQLAELSKNNDNPENLYGKMLTLWNQLQYIKSQRDVDQRTKAAVWRTVREEDIETITKVLEDEQMGIMHATNILKADTKELETIEVSLREKRSRIDRKSVV